MLVVGPLLHPSGHSPAALHVCCTAGVAASALLLHTSTCVTNPFMPIYETPRLTISYALLMPHPATPRMHMQDTALGRGLAVAEWVWLVAFTVEAALRMAATGVWGFPSSVAPPWIPRSSLPGNTCSEGTKGRPASATPLVLPSKSHGSVQGQEQAAERGVARGDSGGGDDHGGGNGLPLAPSKRKLKAYFRSKWNVLDFIVVVLGWVDAAGAGSSGATAVRALRVLRPLRAINKVPQLRVSSFHTTVRLLTWDCTAVCSVRK